MAATPSDAPAVFNPAQYPDAEKTFPGVAAAIHTLGGPRESDALAALNKIGGAFDSDGNVKLSCIFSALAAQKALTSAMTANLKDIASQGGPTAAQTDALKALGGDAAVVAMSLIQQGKVAEGVNMLTDAVAKTQGAVLHRKSSRVSGGNTLSTGLQIAEAELPTASGHSPGAPGGRPSAPRTFI